MSLILEALRKLERDKEAPERGFVVLTHVPWARGGGRSRLVGLGALALSVAMGALAIAVWRGRVAPTVSPETRAPASVRPAAAPGARSGAPRPAFEAKALAVESLRSAAAPAQSASPVPATPRPEAPPPLELRLNAISQRDGQPVAVLNDRLVREGEVFDGIRVIRIGEAEVEVEVAGRRRILTF